MDDMVYTIIQARALHTLHDMLEETNQMEPGPQARLQTRLRATIGRRLIQLGTLLTQPGAEPRRQTQSI